MDKRMNRKRMDHKGLDHEGMDQKGMGHRVSSGPVRGPARQRGAVLVLVAVGMLAIIGMAGLALQSGHLFVNKTHLQNALDAAALSAAKTLNNDGTVETAIAAGQEAFENHRAPATGTSTFLERQMRDSSYTLAFAFSATLDPFTPGATETGDPPATFVRASATDFTMDTWLANVLPGVGDEQDIGGTAVAGPAPIDPANTCDVLPLLMCAPDPNAVDRDCSDEGGSDEGECFGWEGGDKEVCLKEADGGHQGSACPDALQQGNFHLLRLGGPGANIVRDALAGGYSGCVALGQTAPTQPGNIAGPVHQGLNTRFGDYQGGGMNRADYPPDTVTNEAPGPVDGTCTGFCYDQYVADQLAGNYDNPPPDAGDGVPDRRKVAAAIGDCRDLPGGATQVPVIGIGCFFLTRKAGIPPLKEVYGQLVGDCQADGNIAAGPLPGGSLRYRIVLYKDPDSRDS